MQSQNAQWQHIRVKPDLEAYPVQLHAISRPAGLEAAGPCRDNLEALQKLQPPLQTGSFPKKAAFGSAVDCQRNNSAHHTTLPSTAAGVFESY
jgi:hypothetical protein